MTKVISTDKILGPVVSSALLPSLTISLNHRPNSALDINLVQILFVIYSSLSDDNAKSEYALLIIPSLCKLFEVSPRLDRPASNFAGKALTHIARTSPEILRYAIPKLDEANRALLQTAMRLTMEQEQQNESRSQSAEASSKPSTLKKIDSVKFTSKK